MTQITGMKELDEKIRNVIMYIQTLDGMNTNGDGLFYQTPILFDNEEEAREPELVQIVKKHIDDEVCHLLDQ